MGDEQDMVYQLMEQIKVARKVLDNLTENGLDGEEILKFSQELDLLINKYYELELKK